MWHYDSSSIQTASDIYCSAALLGIPCMSKMKPSTKQDKFYWNSNWMLSVITGEGEKVLDSNCIVAH